MPTLLTSTVPLLVTLTLPSRVSVAVGATSLYVVAASWVTSLFTIVIDGAVVSTTVTVLVAVALFPTVSVEV